jgi:hypothetical protein
MKYHRSTIYHNENALYVTFNNKVTHSDVGVIHCTTTDWLKPKKMNRLKQFGTHTHTHNSIRHNTAEVQFTKSIKPVSQ